jgi:hypothetical protein
MITHSVKGKRHILGMNEEDFQIFAEVIWLIQHGVPSIGFNRKPLTPKQQKIVEEIFSRFSYDDNFGIYLNRMTGQ